MRQVLLIVLDGIEGNSIVAWRKPGYCLPAQNSTMPDKAEWHWSPPSAVSLHTAQGIVRPLKLVQCDNLLQGIKAPLAVHHRFGIEIITQHCGVGSSSTNPQAIPHCPPSSQTWSGRSIK